MPELAETETLHEQWHDLGMARIMPMGGVAGFEWQEVRAFIEAAGADINPQEARCLVDMSRAYASFYADTNVFSKSPMERDSI